MDYVDGSDSGRLLRERYPAGMPADEVVEITTAVAGALDFAHPRPTTRCCFDWPNFISIRLFRE
jgi:hypothetical protein